MDDPSNPSISGGAGVRTDCCYMCGSTSYDKLLIACKVCNCCIHVYCYFSFCTGAVKDGDEDEWVCEYCQPPNLACSSKPAASKFTTGAVKFKRPLLCISEDEVAAIGAGSSTPEGRGPPTPPEKPCVRVEETENNTEDILHSPSSINPPEPAPDVLTSSPIPASSSGQDRNVEKHVHVELPFSLAEPSRELQTCKELTDSRIVNAQGDGLCTNQLKTRTNIVEQGLEDAQVKLDGCLPNPPFQHPAWKGSFIIMASGFGASADLYDKIWGYLPVKTSMRAFEFSKKMPDILQFDVVSRDAIWANIFAEEGPNKDDIGLYFLPADNRPEQCYCCLVSLLEKLDAVIRCRVDGVQLLFFTSKHLDDKSQKINGAYYLWGLFIPPDVAFKEPPQIDAPIPRDSQTSSSSSKVRGKKAMEDGINTALHNADCQPILSVQVKIEDCDEIDLGPPPGFAPRPELDLPPGFFPRPELTAPPDSTGVNRRVKFRSIGELLRKSD